MTARGGRTGGARRARRVARALARESSMIAVVSPEIQRSAIRVRSAFNAAALTGVMNAQAQRLKSVYGDYAWSGVRLSGPDAFSRTHTLRLDLDGRLAANDIRESGYASVSLDGKRIVRPRESIEWVRRLGEVSPPGDGGGHSAARTFSPLPGSAGTPPLRGGEILRDEDVSPIGDGGRSLRRSAAEAEGAPFGAVAPPPLRGEERLGEVTPRSPSPAARRRPPTSPRCPRRSARWWQRYRF